LALLKRHCSPFYSNAQNVGAPAIVGIASIHQSGYSIRRLTVQKLEFASQHGWAVLVTAVVHQV
jgi:hypothetical protein